MAKAFTHSFEEKLPLDAAQQRLRQHKDKPLLTSVTAEAQATIAQIEVFRSLPERNQKLILDMTRFAIGSANGKAGINNKLDDNWGLYVTGAWATGDAMPHGTLALLSVGTFGRDHAFLGRYNGTDVFRGFTRQIPEQLLDETLRNCQIKQRYQISAYPQEAGVLPVNLKVGNLAAFNMPLRQFLEVVDVGQGGRQLPHIPLFELTVPAA